MTEPSSTTPETRRGVARRSMLLTGLVGAGGFAAGQGLDHSESSSSATSSRSVDAHPREPSTVVDVRSFGARGDGETDDSEAILHAIGKAESRDTQEPSIVWFPYTSTGYNSQQLSLPSGVGLYGDRKVVLRKVGATTATFITAAGADVKIADLTLDANGRTETRMIQMMPGATRAAILGCHLIDSGHRGALCGVEVVDDVADTSIDNNTFEGVDTGVCVIRGPRRCRIRDNQIVSWKTRGIYVAGDSGSASSDLVISGNHIFGNVNSGGTRHPIQIVGVDSMPHRRIKVTLNTVIGSDKSWTQAADPGTADQISLHRCVDFEVTGNVSMYGGDMGMTISQQCARGVVANNILTRNDVGALALGSDEATYVRDITVTGNIAMNNGQNRVGDRASHSRTGFYIRNAQRIVVTGNLFGDDQAVSTQQYAMSIWSSRDVLHMGNLITDMGRGSIYSGDEASTRVGAAFHGAAPAPPGAVPGAATGPDAAVINAVVDALRDLGLLT